MENVENMEKYGEYGLFHILIKHNFYFTQKV